MVENHIKNCFSRDNVNAWKKILEWAPEYSLTLGWKSGSSIVNDAAFKLRFAASDLLAKKFSQSASELMEDGVSTILAKLYEQIKNGKSEINSEIWNQLFEPFAKFLRIEQDNKESHASFDAVKSLFSLTLPKDTEERKKTLGIAADIYAELNYKNRYDEIAEFLIQCGLDPKNESKFVWSSNIGPVMEIGKSLRPSKALELNLLKSWSIDDIADTAMRLRWNRNDYTKFLNLKNDIVLYGNENLNFDNEEEDSKQYKIIDKAMEERGQSQQERLWLAAETAWSANEFEKRVVGIFGIPITPWNLIGSFGENLLQHLILNNPSILASDIDLSWLKESDIENIDKDGFKSVDYLMACIGLFSEYSKSNSFESWEENGYIVDRIKEIAKIGFDIKKVAIDNSKNAIKIVERVQWKKDQFGELYKSFKLQSVEKIIEKTKSNPKPGFYNNGYMYDMKNRDVADIFSCLVESALSSKNWGGLGVMTLLNENEIFENSNVSGNVVLIKNVVNLFCSGSNVLGRNDFIKTNIMYAIKMGADYDRVDALINTGVGRLSALGLTAMLSRNAFEVIRPWWNNEAKLEFENIRLKNAVSVGKSKVIKSL